MEIIQCTTKVCELRRLATASASGRRRFSTVAYEYDAGIAKIASFLRTKVNLKYKFFGIIRWDPLLVYALLSNLPLAAVRRFVSLLKIKPKETAYRVGFHSSEKFYKHSSSVTSHVPIGKYINLFVYIRNMNIEFLFTLLDWNVF